MMLADVKMPTTSMAKVKPSWVLVVVEPGCEPTSSSAAGMSEATYLSKSGAPCSPAS